MQLLDIKTLPDGGTKQIVTTSGTFYQDYRIGSTTKGKIFDLHPSNPAAQPVNRKAEDKIRALIQGSSKHTETTEEKPKERLSILDFTRLVKDYHTRLEKCSKSGVYKPSERAELHTIHKTILEQLPHWVV